MNQILYQRLKSSINKHLMVLALLSFIIVIPYCTTTVNKEKLDAINEVILIPTPKKLLYKRGVFDLKKTTRVLLNLSDQKSKTQGEYLLAKLKDKTGYTIKISDRFTTSKIKSSIEIITDKWTENIPESFKIDIKGSKIKIYANDTNGLFYAINTVVELFNKKDPNGWQAPQLLIEDSPKARIRAIRLSIDSIPYTQSNIIKLLQQNRINYLQAAGSFNANSRHNYLKISNSIEFNSSNQSIKSFYMESHTLDTLAFTITDINQLQADSLKVLSEAMWSKTNKLNYPKLIQSLRKE